MAKNKYRENVWQQLFSELRDRTLGQPPGKQHSSTLQAGHIFPSNPFLSTVQEKWTQVHTKIWMQMFILALFITLKTWKHECLSNDRQKDHLHVERWHRNKELHRMHESQQYYTNWKQNMLCVQVTWYSVRGNTTVTCSDWMHWS